MLLKNKVQIATVAEGLLLFSTVDKGWKKEDLTYTTTSFYQNNLSTSGESSPMASVLPSKVNSLVWPFFFFTFFPPRICSRQGCSCHICFHSSTFAFFYSLHIINSSSISSTIIKSKTKSLVFLLNLAWVQPVDSLILPTQLTSPPRYGFWATASSERQHSQQRQIGLLTWLDVELLTCHFCAIRDANTSFNQRTLVVGIPRAFVSPWQATLAGRCFAYQAWWINMLLENTVSEACQLILRLSAPPFIVQTGLREILNPSRCRFKVSSAEVTGRLL